MICQKQDCQLAEADVDLLLKVRATSVSQECRDNLPASLRIHIGTCAGIYQL